MNAQVFIDSQWHEVAPKDQQEARRREAENFADLYLLFDYERELFPTWYAKNKKFWPAGKNEVKPHAGVGAAYHAWLRRP
jgi:hypothetical protein